MSARGVSLAALGFAGFVVAASRYGAHRWNGLTHTLRRDLSASRQPVRPATVSFDELDALPAPVQRFFRTALTEGQPMISGVRVRHAGAFDMGKAAPQWKPFTSDQVVTVNPPGFDWDARIAVLPGVDARVHDSYVDGEGVLHASMLGLVPLVDQRGAGALAEGELMRWFAEAAWYPTALLPSQGVEWEAVDERSARGTLTHGSIRLTMLFRFNADGLIDSVRADARGRMVGGTPVPTPWEGRFWNYVERDGMRVPLEGEVSWILPEGARPYWRGRLTELAYEWASPAAPAMSGISNRMPRPGRSVV